MLLLLDETGTGKELVARALYEGSRAAEGPFIAVNCGAVARELVASTLFGHRKGAFTGATDARRGAYGEWIGLDADNGARTCTVTSRAAR